jgi:hypothetical protein
MTKADLIHEAFGHINTFKRHRALKDIEGYNKKDFHELQMYKKIDQLELALRALNKGIREEEGIDTEESTTQEE